MSYTTLSDKKLASFIHLNCVFYDFSSLLQVGLSSVQKVCVWQ
jgi:hypothetical protein